MKRLTNNTYNGLIKCQDCIEESNCYEQSCGHIEKAIHKLQEYENLESKGLLIKLPCKVEDIVYDTTLGFIEKCVVTEIEILADDIDIRLISDVTTGTVSCDDFGKTLFPTREEAEKKLNDIK